VGLASSGCATQIPHDSKLGAFGIVWGPVIGVFKAETTASFTNPFAALRARREGLALDVIRAVADNARLDGSLTSDLAEAELADFFIWTYKRLPPPSDDRKSGFRWVGVARQSGWEHSDNQDGHFGGRGGRMIVAARR
jgi:hypothetical protein